MVVDASIAIAWCIEAETTDETVALLEELRRTEGVVPPIWLFEVLNALLVAERRGRMMEADTAEALRLLLDLPIRVSDGSFGDGGLAVLALARRERLSAYDASYLVLAIRRRCRLATLDARIRAVAQRVGVPVA